EQDLQVQPEGPCLGVSEIQTDHVVEAKPAAPVHLPQPGDSRLGLEHASAVPRPIGLELVRNRGPGADERHLALQDVEKLWELIEARLAEEATHPSDARVTRDLVHDVPVLSGHDVPVLSGGRGWRPATDELRDEVAVLPRIVLDMHGAELQGREGDPTRGE